MTKIDIARKLTSRKFWAAVASFVTALIVAFKGDPATAEKIAGIIMAGATCIAYIIGEGLVDAESAKIEEPTLTCNYIDNAELITHILDMDSQGKVYDGK